ncbi:MAG: hypothetical protein ACK5W3_02475 [Hyphomonadaceae bacterium]
MTERWIRTDEPTDVLGSIRSCLRTAAFVEEDPQAFKWLVLSLHSALQGACVCHLTTTAPPLGAVNKKNALEWIEYFDKRRDNPKEKEPKTHLMCLPGLLSAVRRPNSVGSQDSNVAVAISDREFNLLKRFHTNIRNQFVHFAPMGWSIEVSGFPEIAELVARIIGEMHQIGWAFRHLEPTAQDELSQKLRILAAFKWP